MAYLLDTNVFIKAYKLHYGFDFCPAFWDWLIAAHTEGKVFSVAKVYDELRKKNDGISKWAKKMDSSFFLPIDPTVQPELELVSSWVSKQPHKSQVKRNFLNGADYYLVAQARAGKHTVVTHEIAKKSKRKIKIPIACKKLHIKCLTPHAMLRKERARFVLKAAA